MKMPNEPNSETAKTTTLTQLVRISSEVVRVTMDAVRDAERGQPKMTFPVNQGAPNVSQKRDE